MAFTGSISENRVNLGIPAPIREELYAEARQLGLRITDHIRYILIERSKARQREREQRK